jgi:SAM-dependent methyltransferase
LFPNIKKYIGLEWEKEITHPEVVGNCQKLPFKDRSFQSVLATQVLEHLPDPYQAVSEMARVLEGGGHLVITAPQAWRLHGMPHDYYRFTRFGLVYLMESQGLEVIKVEAQGGVWALLGQTFLNMVPHRNLFPLTTPVVLLVNTLCLIMDNLWYDPFDTLNYLIVGHKP